MKANILLIKIFLIAAIFSGISACVEEHVAEDDIVSIEIISSNAASNIIPLNLTRQFHVEALLTDGTTTDVTQQISWSGGDTVFIVNDTDAKGLVTPSTTGNSTLQASIAELVASYDITITEALPSNNGDIIVSEIMKSPQILNDNNGEWFEIYNPTSTPYSLIGCIVTDLTSDIFTIDEDIVISTDSHVIFSNNIIATDNVDFVYDNFTLNNNSNDEIILDCNNKQISWIQYDDGTSFPSSDGISISLDPLKLDSSYVNDGKNWCDASSTYNGDLGTPGSLNDSCPTAQPATSPEPEPTPAPAPAPIPAPITPPVPVEITITPQKVILLDGHEVQFTADVTGTSNTDVSWSLLEGDPALLTNDGLFTAPATNDVFHVKATSNADSSKTATADIEVSTISIEIAPSSPVMRIEETLQLAATILESDNKDVVWSDTNGFISESGLFTAPLNSGSYSITATSTADSRKSTAITIEVLDPIELTFLIDSVSVNTLPSSYEIFGGQVVKFNATVNNSAQGLTWNIAGNQIANTTTYEYTAPSTAGDYVVKVASQEDPSINSSITIHVREIEISLSALSTSINIGEELEINADVLAPTKHQLNWKVDDASNGSIANGLFSATAVGTYTITATSSVDSSISSTIEITVTEPPAEISISIEPAEVTIYEGQTATFSGNVLNAADPSINWQIITAGTNEEVGAISPDGLYTAPNSPGSFQIRITSIEDNTKSAVATITVEQISLAITPITHNIAPAAQAQFTSTNNGNITNNITWSSSAGSISNTGLFTAPNTTGTFTITATSLLDNSKTASTTVTVAEPSPISISISPQEVTIFELENANFTAEVLGTTNKGVTWEIVGFHGGITQSGNYFSSIFSPGSYLISATSKADPNQVAYATIHVEIVNVAIDSFVTALSPGEQLQLNATVTGHAGTDVQWTASNGIIDPTGLYTAPANPGTYQINATSVADNRKTAVTTVTVESDSDIRISMGTTHKTKIYTPETTILSATVSGIANREIIWSIVEPDGGTISNAGLYTPPDRAGTFQVIATSAADTTKFASATIQVGKIEVSLTADHTTVLPGQRVQLYPIVTGSIDTDLVFYLTMQGAAGPNDTFIAPQTPGNYIVEACTMEPIVDLICAAVTITVIEPAYFEFTDNNVDGDTFVIQLTEATKIQQARDIISNNSSLGVMGIIIKETTAYNPQWSYHLDPNSISFFEISTEVCDASIQYVEDNLAIIGGATLPENHWCPWGSDLTREVTIP